MPETCSRCGEEYPLEKVIINQDADGDREVICPECAEPEDRIITDGGIASATGDSTVERTESPTRRLTFDQIATTQDSGDPVIRAELRDTGSWMELIIDNAEETLRVAFVESKLEGDMSGILDEIVRQMGWTHVMFLTPLNDQLSEKLHGFTEETEYVEKIDDEMTYLEGEWVLDD